MRSSERKSAMSRSNVVSDDTLLVSRAGVDFARVDAVREPDEAAAFLAVAAHQLHFARRAADRRCGESRRGQTRRAHLADAEDEADRLGRPGRPAHRSRPSTAKPRGLSISEAILARNLLQDSPIETVMPQLLLDVGGKARQAPWRRKAHAAAAVPERSRNASSIESGSTSGVSASIICRTSRPTREYFSMLGRMTLACGHRRNASNIGMADLIP